jgi:hypothetical protein
MNVRWNRHWTRFKVLNANTTSVDTALYKCRTHFFGTTLSQLARRSFAWIGMSLECHLLSRALCKFPYNYLQVTVGVRR